MAIKCLDKSNQAKCLLHGKMRSEGWIALGLSKTNKTSDAVYVYGAMDSVMTNPLPPFYNVTLRKDLYKEMGMISLEFYLNFSMAIEMNYLVFAMKSDSFKTFNILENTFLTIKNNRNVSENCVILQPDLLEGQHLAPTIIMMLLGVVFLFLWLCFKDFHPLSSRGLAPPLNILSIYGVYAAQLFYFGADMEYRYYVSCYIQGILINALHQTTFLIIFINFLRFFVIQISNSRKEELLNSRYNDETEDVESLIYILDYITTPFFSLIIICSYTLILITITILCNIPFSDGGKCTGYSYSISQIIYGVLGLIIFCSLLLLQLFDYFYTLFKNRCRLYNFYFVTDPFYFRLELIHLPFLAIYYVIWEIVSYLFVDEKYIISMIFNSIYVYWIVFFQSLAIILLTASLTIYKLCKPKEEFTKDNLKKVLTSKKTRPWFIEYAKNEWSLENIMIWDEINKYLNEQKPQKRKIISEYIIKNFLTSGAIFEVNLNKGEVGEVIKRVKNEEFDDNLYENILGSILLNLSDTYSRFLFYDQRYIDYLNQNEAHKELKKEKSKYKEIFQTKTI